MFGRELDLDDLYTVPDDGNRYEILDSALVMTPAPGSAHQNALMQLGILLDGPARASGMRVLPAPEAWRIGPGQVPEPDLVVAATELITARAIVGRPALVVEILSPTGRSRDLIEKRRIYADGGASWYWIVDPSVPSLTVLRLVAGAYEDEATVIGADAYEAREPFPVRVVPADLLS